LTIVNSASAPDFPAENRLRRKLNRHHAGRIPHPSAPAVATEEFNNSSSLELARQVLDHAPSPRSQSSERFVYTDECTNMLLITPILPHVEY
ncbi:MAG: hypothetical protein KAS32_08035, partial [Candidatus Peribacteraceae bacterium]|nr:hypothetical protein [Candidatus Peribacteraceae bacterium]